MMQQYRIWSFEHQAWWRPGHAGYTMKQDEAGLYEQNEALDICFNANRFPRSNSVDECMVPIES